MKDKVNEIKVSYNGKIKNSKNDAIKSSADAAQLLFDTWNKDTIELYESFKLILLNNSNNVKGIYEMSSGGITGTVVDLRILYAIALKTLSTAIIVAHNHPSGKLKPSEADKSLTLKIKKAGEVLDIKLLDHIIVTPSCSFYSFADECMI